MADQVLINDDSYGAQGGHSESTYNTSPAWLTTTDGATDNGDTPPANLTGNGFAAAGDSPLPTAQKRAIHIKR